MGVAVHKTGQVRVGAVHSVPLSIRTAKIMYFGISKYAINNFKHLPVAVMNIEQKRPKISSLLYDSPI